MIVGDPCMTTCPKCGKRFDAIAGFHHCHAQCPARFDDYTCQHPAGHPGDHQGSQPGGRAAWAHDYTTHDDSEGEAPA